MSTTAQLIIYSALQDLGVLGVEETPTSAQSAGALRRLNLMMGQWSLQDLTIPVIARDVFDLTANKGGPSNPYTIGPGGNFDTTRPTAIVGAGLLLTASSPNVEIPRAVITDDAWQAIQVKDLTSTLFNDVYYNPTFSGGLGTINLWPIPDNATNDIVLYRRAQLGAFTSLTATYELPEGAEEAIQHNLGVRLAPSYAVPLDILQPIMDLARLSLSIYKKSNVKLFDLPTDYALTANNRTAYNVVTGQGG